MECKRCGYEWVSKVENPKQCPKCKQYYYNIGREWEKIKQDNTNKDSGVIQPDIKELNKSSNKQEEVIKLD